MAKTLSNAAKTQIMRVLNKQGYPSYARLLEYFDIYLTDDPEVVGYMMPKKAQIVLNKDLSINQVSTIVRHEILHEYLTHFERTQKFNAGHKELLPLGADHDASNIAGDFEISNKGYTDADKAIARSIILGDKVLRGLVTEDQYPGWENMTFEEMYELILKEIKEDKEQIKKLLQQLQKLNKKDIEDMVDELDDMSNGGGSNDNGEGEKGNNSSSSSNNNNSEENNNNKTGSGDSGSSKDKDNKNKDENGAGTEEDKLSKEEQELRDEAKKAKEALEKIQGQLEKENNNDKSSGGAGVFQDGKKVDPDLVKRVAKIKEIFNDLKQREAILDDSRRAQQKERIAKAAKNIERKNEDPLTNFKLNLNRFIADQIQESEDDSYARVHPSYEDSEFILPGKLVRENKYIPVINVYHDASGSFDNPAKTEMAMKAIDTLNKYVRDGDIEINVYYHADTVGSTREEVGWGNNGNNVMRHIQATKPTNVIIITDGDLRDTNIETVVPGAVWMLFYGVRSSGLMKSLRGKKQTKYYDITW